MEGNEDITFPVVLNIKTDVVDLDVDVYCGRPSKWGNPFVVGRDGDRNLCIVRYIEWFNNQDDLIDSLPELRGKNLVCYCAPHACHCDYLIRRANDTDNDSNDMDDLNSAWNALFPNHQGTLVDPQKTEVRGSNPAGDYITPQVCKDNPNTLYVFGDNLEGWGKKGQSVIRDEPNTFGIPTKTSPSVYMTDDQLHKNKEELLWAFCKLELLAKNYQKIYIIPHIGEGLADLPNKAPKTYESLKGFIKIFSNSFSDKIGG